MPKEFKYHITSPRLKNRKLKEYWFRFWMKLYRIGISSKIIIRIATLFAPPHKAGSQIARMNKKGYLSSSAIIYHPDLWLGEHVYIAVNVTIYKNKKGGKIEIGDNVYLYKDSILETGFGGSLEIKSWASIHPRCQINAYVAPITIGKGVMIAPNCALYSYNHSFAPDTPIRKQPLKSNGPIIIEDEAWLGYGAIVLSGVRIGQGAVIGAGSVVMDDVPSGAIAVGNPARVVKNRSEIKQSIAY